MAQFTNKRTLLPAAIIAAGIALLLLLFATKPTPSAKPQQERVWPVNVVTVRPGTHQPNLQLYGSVESPKQSTLKSAIEADVLAKPVDEGDRVKKGQMLIELDNRDAKLIFTQRNADVKSFDAQIAAEIVRNNTDKEAIKHERDLIHLTQREVKRREQLFKSQTGSALDLDNARKTLASQRLQLANREQSLSDHVNRLGNLKAQREKAKALADQAALDVERSEVRAPFDAKVAKIFVAVGNRVRPGDTLIEVFDDDVLEVRTQIPLQYVAQVRAALEKEHKITAQAPVNHVRVEMHLDRLATKVEQGRGGVDGLFTVTKHSDLLEIGKTVAVFLRLLPVDNTIPLPTQALYGLDRVYKIEKERLVAITVTRRGNIINEDGSQSILVSSDELKAGDIVMTSQLPHAISGLKVRIKTEDKP